MDLLNVNAHSYVEFHNATVREQRRIANHVASQASHVETTHYDEPPMAFAEEVTNLLVDNGCPSYLIKDCVKWRWQCKTRQKSVDEIWHEFSRVAIPLITCYLEKGDEITRLFVSKHLLTKDGHWIR